MAGGGARQPAAVGPAGWTAAALAVAVVGIAVRAHVVASRHPEGYAYGIGWLVFDLLNRSCTENFPVHNTSKLPWTAAIRQAYPAIREEYERYIAGLGETLPRLYGEHGFDLDTSALHIDPGRRWRSLFLRVYGVDTKVAAHFPRTMAAYGHAGRDVTTIFFSVLEPGGRLHAHRGPYKGVLRYHLGVIIPEVEKDGQLSLHVLDEHGDVHTMRWAEGHDLLFDDNFWHGARNLVSEPRVVMFVDVLRSDLPRWLRLLNELIVRWLAPMTTVIRRCVAEANLEHCRHYSWPCES